MPVTIDIGPIVNSPGFALAVAPLVKLAVDEAKKYIGVLGSAPGVVKQLVAVALGLVGVVGAQALNGATSVSPEAITAGILAGLGAIASKASDHASEAKQAAQAAAAPATSEEAEGKAS